MREFMRTVRCFFRLVKAIDVVHSDMVRMHASLHELWVRQQEVESKLSTGAGADVITVGRYEELKNRLDIHHGNIVRMGNAINAMAEEREDGE